MSEFDLILENNLKETISTKDGRVRLNLREQYNFINQALMGKTNKQIRKEFNISALEFLDLLNSNKEFAEVFRFSRELGYEELADELVEIPHKNMSVKQAQLLSENIRWLLSKRSQEKYGDKIDIKVEHIDLNQAMTEAKNRALKLERAEFRVLDDDSESES